MKSRYGKFNPKRRLITDAQFEEKCHTGLKELALAVQYGGNPEHKKNPGDFGLQPPSDPRRGKSLCDVARIFQKADALKLLQRGVRRGMVSDRESDGWPKNIWSVTEDGIPLEAQLENPAKGSYHGYPMPDSDPFADEIVRTWKQRCVKD